MAQRSLLKVIHFKSVTLGSVSFMYVLVTLGRYLSYTPSLASTKLESYTSLETAAAAALPGSL